MKTISFTYGPKTIYLYFNAAAMFEIDQIETQLPEDAKDLFVQMQQVTKDGVALLCKVAVVLATQGELCRRYLQYSPSRVPTETELLQCLTPVQMLQLRSCVCQAINEGWSQTESAPEDDIDTGLQELEKKTKP